MQKAQEPSPAAKEASIPVQVTVAVAQPAPATQTFDAEARSPGLPATLPAKPPTLEQHMKPVRAEQQRQVSPGLASRLDRPLGQPVPANTLRRRARSPPIGSIDARSVQPANFAERVSGKSAQPSLLSRLGGGQNTSEIPRGDRPTKRSRREEPEVNSASSAVGNAMQVDDINGLPGGGRTRPESPNDVLTSKGISIFGASRAPTLRSNGESGPRSDGTQTPTQLGLERLGLGQKLEVQELHVGGLAMTILGDVL